MSVFGGTFAVADPISIQPTRYYLCDWLLKFCYDKTIAYNKNLPAIRDTCAIRNNAVGVAVGFHAFARNPRRTSTRITARLRHNRFACRTVQARHKLLAQASVKKVLRFRVKMIKTGVMVTAVARRNARGCGSRI
jgi:hypothetical protein